jgi:hypothetical protein
MITEVFAHGHYVAIKSDVKTEYISRKEAIARIKAVNGITADSRTIDMLEALILATNQARINQLGRGYAKETMITLLSQVAAGRAQAAQRDKKVHLPGSASSTYQTIDEIAADQKWNAFQSKPDEPNVSNQEDNAGDNGKDDKANAAEADDQ